jgi:MFS family permease
MSFTSAPVERPVTRWRRDLGLVAGGKAVSLLGDEVAVIALLLRASDGPHAVAVVAALLVAATVPSIVLAPFAGLVVDRVPTKPLVAVTCFAQALVCLALVVITTPAATVALVALLGVGQTVVGPAWQALVPSVVPEDRLAGALATVQTATASAGILGPALGGLLVGLGGAPLALTLDAVTFLVLATAALLLTGERPIERADGHETLRRQATAGLRLIASDTVLRPLVVLIAVFVLALGAVNVAEVFLVTDVLGASATAYGVVGACFAGGLLLGALVARKPHDEAGLVWRLVLATGLMVLGIAALGLSPVVGAAAVASVVVGAGNGMLNVFGQQLFIRRSPRDTLGRVFAALQAVANAALMSALVVGGALLGLIDVRSLVLGAALVSGLTLLLSSGPLLRSVRR